MNTSFDVQNTDFEGLKIITPFFMEDKRGYFLKSFEKDVFKSLGLDVDIFEEFDSLSSKNVIRGLHFQIKNPQVKIVRVVSGTIMDVVVDLRPKSKTFGKWKSFILSSDNHLSLFIPAGFAHGFKVISETAIMSYKCIGRYDKQSDSGIKWNDETLKIDWGIDNAIVSERDSNLPSFEEYLNNPIEFEQ